MAWNISKRAYLVNKYSFVSKKDIPLPKTYYICVLIVLFGSLYLFINSIDTRDLSVNRIIFSSIILIVVNLTLMWIDEKIYQALLLTSEQKILKQQNEAFKNQAELSADASYAIRALKHDITDHLLILI